MDGFADDGIAYAINQLYKSETKDSALRELTKNKTIAEVIVEHINAPFFL